eukprot:2295706-Rhodomonas_salina.1
MPSAVRVIFERELALRDADPPPETASPRLGARAACELLRRLLAAVSMTVMPAPLLPLLAAAVLELLRELAACSGLG